MLKFLDINILQTTLFMFKYIINYYHYILQKALSE